MGSIILSICLFCAFYTSYRVIGQSSRPRKHKILISLLFIAIFLLPLFLKNKGDLSGGFYSFFYTSAYFCFIVMALFFCLIFIRDIIWAVLCIKEKLKKVETPRFKWHKPDFLTKTNRVLFILSLSICIYSLYAGLKTPDVKETVLISDKIQKPITIAVLSDMHINRTLSKNKVAKMVEITNKIAPDVILFPGDTIDDSIVYIQPHLDELKNLKAPLGIYATAGNHEIVKGNDAARDALTNAGITYLFNDGLVLDHNVYLAGIPDINTAKQINETIDLEKAFKAADISNFKILVSHRPTIVKSLKEGVIDLVIAAHTHGGQIFPFHILSKIQNGYLAGLYEESNTMLYVTRGCGQWGPQMRFLAPSEISIIKILPWADEAAKKADKDSHKTSKNENMKENNTDKSIVYPAKKEPESNFIENATNQKNDVAIDATLTQLQVAQAEADKEAASKDVNEKATASNDAIPVLETEKIESNPQVDNTKIDSQLEEAKESLDTAFEQVISNKVQEDLANERKKNEALQIELTQLRIDLEKTKTDAGKIIVRQNAAIKLLEEERNLLKKALEDQRNALTAELKASQDVIENQRRIIAREQELSRQTLALQKELVRELELLKEDLRKYQQRSFAQRNAGTIYQPIQSKGIRPQTGYNTPQQYMHSPLKPIQVVQNDRMPQNQELRREERFSNLDVIYHSDGSVTRQMVKTVIIEYPTYYSAVKNVASYTTTPQEEANISPVKVENALRQALGLPTTKETSQRSQKKPLLLPLGNQPRHTSQSDVEIALSQPQTPSVFGSIYKH